MSDAINRCSASETAACCCVDVGTIMDNTDCTATFSQLFSTHAEAQAMLQSLSEKARAVESEPCTIDGRISETPQGVQLDCDFIFSCQAETMIFQLALR